MNRRKFLQLSALTSVSMLSCKQQKEPLVTKPKRSQITTARRGDLDIVGKSIKMKVTAYCACEICCGRYADGFTASGHLIHKDDMFVAADKRYPFGTWMYVPGYCRVSTKGCDYGTVMRHIVYVLDRGGAIKGNHIDVYFDTHQEALEWGVQYLDVTVFMLNKRKEQ